MDHLGTIDIEIQLEDRAVSIEASPIQTAIIYAFQDHGIASKTFNLIQINLRLINYVNWLEKVLSLSRDQYCSGCYMGS